MRKLNKREIKSMEAYVSRRYSELWSADGKDEYRAKCDVMHLSIAWLSARSKEITTTHVNSYADTMEEVLGMEERTDEYKASWHEAVKEVEGFMKWMLEWQGIGED